MVLQPAIEGMLGLETDARAGKLTLSPNIPSNWDSLTVRNIRVSDNLVDLQFQRLNESCEFIFNLKQGQPLRIDFFPAFAPGTEIGKIMLDGREVPAATFTMPQSQNISVSFDLVKRSVLTVETSGGINILPVIPDPRPGDNAEGIRILSSRLIKDIFHVEVEGLSGTTAELLLWAGTDYQPTTTNMVQISRDKKVTRYMVTFKPSEQKYQTEILTWKINQK
jgi:hypothetical protein